MEQQNERKEWKWEWNKRIGGNQSSKQSSNQNKYTITLDTTTIIIYNRLIECVSHDEWE
jgi:hypothetical protein